MAERLGIEVELTRDGAAWDHWVRGREDATPYHRWDWMQLVDRVYGLEWRGRVARWSGGAVAGVLPAYAMRTLSGERVLVSTPFANHGGPLCDDGQAAGILLRSLAAEMEAGRIGYVEVKCRMEWAVEGFQVKRCYDTLQLELQKDADAVWREKVNTKARNQVRKARREGLRVRVGLDLVEAAYGLHLRNSRDLGTPSHGGRWFEVMADLFQESMEVIVVFDGGRAVATGVLLIEGNGAVLHHAASDQRALTKCPNNLLYWACIEWGSERGLRRLDFGRSRQGSGTHHFKRQWGAIPYPTPYLYCLAGGRRMPDQDPNNPSFRSVIGLWRHMPLSLAASAGPILRKRITT